MKYFISYSHNKNGTMSFGNTSIELKFPISDDGDISKITEIIEKEQQIYDVVILNFKKFEKVENHE
jgi:hypothetical protein